MRENRRDVAESSIKKPEESPMSVAQIPMFGRRRTRESQSVLLAT